MEALEDDLKRMSTDFEEIHKYLNNLGCRLQINTLHHARGGEKEELDDQQFIRGKREREHQ